MGVSATRSGDTLLKSIVGLADHLFDHASVMERWPETTSRAGALRADDSVRLPELRNVNARLVRAHRELAMAFRDIKKLRRVFLNTQLRALGITRRSSNLKLHIGSADYLLEGWLNIDAGGADLALSVNWDLPLRDGCVQFAYCAHMLEHLRYNDQAPVFVREIHRLLHRGGVARFVVPDLRKLFVAYALNDRRFFRERQKYYPLSKGFQRGGVPSLDYLLLFSGAGPQMLNYNHKFGYDSKTLCRLLMDAGFRIAKESGYQASRHAALRVDDCGYNANAKVRGTEHFSLFVEATK